MRINATRMTTPIEEKVDQKLKVRTGMVSVSDGKSRPVPVRLHLSMEVLRLQKEEIVPPERPLNSKERMVQIRRQKVGGLGLSIKGGAEHKLPILISRIYKNQAAEQTGELFVGDAIIKVNGEYITACPHDDAVNILRNAGDLVVLTVKHYKAATPFLQKQEEKEQQDSSNSEDKETSDESLKVTSSSGSRPSSLYSECEQEPLTRWIDIVTLPLMMAYVTRYIFGTDKLRPNSFEVRGLNGISTGIIHCDDTAILSQWLKYITDNIIGLTNLQINVSQDEYSHMMEVYLSTRRSSNKNDVQHLVTFDVGSHFRDSLSTNTVELKSQDLPRQLEVDSGELKLLISPVSPTEPEVVQVRLFETFGPKQRQFVTERTLYLSHNETKWCEFDVTDAVQWWLNDKIISKLELICLNCKSELKVREAFVNALVFKEVDRRKRSVSPFDQSRRTDCRYTSNGKHKVKCCRHNMTVTFKDLRFPEMASIVQPKNYEAGYCQGRCPPNYNYATNHSRIQTLVHQLDKKNARQNSRRAIPKACCSPSKLEPLEIIRVDPYNSAKLIVEKWENMQVTECACS